MVCFTSHHATCLEPYACVALQRSAQQTATGRAWRRGAASAWGALGPERPAARQPPSAPSLARRLLPKAPLLGSVWGLDEASAAAAATTQATTTTTTQATTTQAGRHSGLIQGRWLAPCNRNRNRPTSHRAPPGIPPTPPHPPLPPPPQEASDDGDINYGGERGGKRSSYVGGDDEEDDGSGPLQEGDVDSIAGNWT